MKIGNIFALAFLLQLGDSYASEKMIEIPCQNGKALIQPKIKLLPNGYGLQFITTWGNKPPYILVVSSDGEYQPQIIPSGATSVKSNKFMGHIILNDYDVISLQFDGCQIQWGEYL